MESITQNWHDSAIISTICGGLGIDYSSLRHSEIGNHGNSKGIIPWIRIENEILLGVDQVGRRKGSGTIFLRDCHMDIFEFTEMKDEGPRDMRARDLFYAIMVSDLFMKRVKNDESWSLFCPNKAKGLFDKWGVDFELKYSEYESKGLFSKQVKARELWKHILLQQMKNGMPFIGYIDAANRKSNQMNVGMIRNFNLCVSGDTYILTKKGQLPIKDLVNTKISVWNGSEWSKVSIKQTGEHQNLLRVELSNGSHIECTPEHKFYIQKNYHSKHPVEVRAKDLEVGCKLIKWNLPEIVEFDDPIEFKYPYTHGFLCGDGTAYDNYSKTEKYYKVYLYGENKKLLRYIDQTSWSEDNDKITAICPKDIDHKFEIPMYSNVNTRLRWLEGYVDADGTIARNGTNEAIQIGSIHKEFLIKVRLMLQTLGVESKVTLALEERDHTIGGPDHNGSTKIYRCERLWRLLITSNGLYHLSTLGFSPKRLQFTSRMPQRGAAQYVTVNSIEEGPQDVDTFCFTEHKRHMGMFNGILTGQCMEIAEVTSEEDISSCVLTTLVVVNCIEDGKFNFNKLDKLMRQVVRNLYQIIIRNYYPPNVPRIKNTIMRDMPLGIGIQGLADACALLDISWVLPDENGILVLTEKARKLSKDIAETMYYAGMSESMKISKENGKPYASFEGSPLSKGLFQFDLWNLESIYKKYTGVSHPDINNELLEQYKNRYPNESIYTNEQWDTLRSDVMTYGVANSMLIAIPPTASSAHILGNNEGTEPYNNMICARTLLSGQYPQVVKRFVKDMKAIGMWNSETVRNIMSNNGSISQLKGDHLSPASQERLAFLKYKYLTIYEIPHKAILQMAIDRGQFTCQTQSTNHHSKEPDFKKLNAALFFAWENGLKTGMYYLRKPSAGNPTNFALNSIVIPEKKNKNASQVCTDEVCTSCSV
jgi:ribonucleoside-diphosphate reductase alpha chain